MMALAQSFTEEMSSFKISIFETLLQAAKWPQFKGKVAGSGVLGVISALFLSPKASAESRALMARLCGALAADAQDVAQLGDTQRAEDRTRKKKEALQTTLELTYIYMIKYIYLILYN